MKEASLLARLHDRPGALERAIGLIRRRAHGIRRISVGSARSNIELVLRVDESRTPRERVRRDLLGLEDLIDVRDLAGHEATTRELMLAWIRSDATQHVAESGRVVAASGTSSLIEVTGTPAEIDALFGRLDELDALITSVRSGEVAAPMITPELPSRVVNSELGTRNPSAQREPTRNPEPGTRK